MRELDEITQELEDVQEMLCELYSKRKQLEKEYRLAVLSRGLQNVYEIMPTY